MKLDIKRPYFDRNGLHLVKKETKTAEVKEEPIVEAKPKKTTKKKG